MVVCNEFKVASCSIPIKVVCCLVIKVFIGKLVDTRGACMGDHKVS